MGRILGGGWGVGGLEKEGTLRGLRFHRDVNPPQAANSLVVVLLCCYVVGCTYLIYLPT